MRIQAAPVTKVQSRDYVFASSAMHIDRPENRVEMGTARLDLVDLVGIEPTTSSMPWN